MNKAKTIHGALFDVDGTLIDVEERFFWHYNDRLNAIGIPAVDRTAYEIMRAQGVLSQPIPDVGDNRADFWLSFIEDFSHSNHTELGQAIPGSRYTLDWLKERGFHMGVITGRTSLPDRVEMELTQHGLAKYFEVVLTNRNGASGMNKAENIIRAAALLGLTAGQCIYVGDWQGDVESAREAGIGIMIAVLTGGESGESLEKFKPDVILKSVAEIPEYLDSVLDV